MLKLLFFYIFFGVRVTANRALLFTLAKQSELVRTFFFPASVANIDVTFAAPLQLFDIMCFEFD